MQVRANSKYYLQRYKHWHYKNTFFLLLSLIVFFYFADSPLIKSIISRLGDAGYFGAFLTGIFFVSIFTVAPALVVLYFLSNALNPIIVALLAGLGAVIGDYIVFRFLKDGVFKELAPLFRAMGGSHISKLFHTPHFAWLLPAIGAIIIASPLPDETGIALIGTSHMKQWQFFILTFILNTIGILMVVVMARSI